MVLAKKPFSEKLDPLPLAHTIMPQHWALQLQGNTKNQTLGKSLAWHLAGAGGTRTIDILGTADERSAVTGLEEGKEVSQTLAGAKMS